MEAGLTLGPDRVGGVGRQQRGLNGCSRKKRPGLGIRVLPLEVSFLLLLWLRCYTVSVAIRLLPFSPILRPPYFLVLPGTFIVQVDVLLAHLVASACRLCCLRLRCKCPGITTVTTAATPRPASLPRALDRLSAILHCPSY